MLSDCMNKNILILIFLYLVIIIILKLSIEKNKIDHYNPKINSINNDENTDYYLPKKTWTYWDNIDSIPPDIIDIINTRNKHLNGYDNILLTKSNIYDYIDIKEFPKNYNKLSIPAKTDWIRLYLLYTYGGIWMDASIIITKLHDIDEIYNNCYKNKYELMAFYLEQRTINNDIYSFIESWFLIAPINSNVIKKWKKEFEHAVDIGFDEYFDEIKNNVNITNLGNTSYLTIHATIKKLITYDEIDKNKIYLKKAEDDMFNIHTKCKWKRWCIADALNKNEHLKLKYVKLRGDDRESGNIKAILIDIHQYLEEYELYRNIENYTINTIWPYLK